MKYALFLGCNIPARLEQYEVSARLILDMLDVELVDISDFNCCGYPLRNFDFNSFVLSSARNIALAKKQGLNIITLCQCCFGSLKKAQQVMREDSSLAHEIKGILKKENLDYGDIEINHLLSVLYHQVGTDVIKSKITRPYNDLKIAVHYGCHALRPSDIMEFDDAADPTLFDQLVEITGAKSVSWPSRLDCCGAPLMGVNDELSINIMNRKVKDSKGAGAEFLCVACPYCQIQFDKVQKSRISEGQGNGSIASIIYTQLLGLSMGIEADKLQLSKNELDIIGIKEFL